MLKSRGEKRALQKIRFDNIPNNLRFSLKAGLIFNEGFCEFKSLFNEFKSLFK